MRKLFWAAVILPLMVFAAAAMQQSQVPPKFPVPWGNSATATYLRSIPVPSQIGIQNCAASLTDGFPPLTFVPATAGGCPPFGADFNGILKQITQWSQWQGAGASPTYDSSFSTSIGGYPSGTVLANASTAGCFWVSTVDNNSSDPDTGGANWSSSCPGGGVGGTSTGSANAQVVAATPFVRRVGSTVTYVAGFSNSGPLQVNVNGAGLVNVFRRSQLGATMSVGGETFTGQNVTITWDGTRWQCTSCAFVRVGEVVDMATTTLPAGHLVVDGSCVSQSTYADLFSLTGTAFGSCSAGNFALPDLRGRMTAGYDGQGTQGAANRLTSGGSSCAATTIGVGCGAQNATLAQNQLPNVSPTFSGNSSGQAFYTGTPGQCVRADACSYQIATASVATPSGTVSSINGGVTQQTTPVVPPIQTVTKVIRF